MSSLFYFFKESLTGFSRNLSTALGSIITIFLSLFVIGVFLVGGIIVENIVSSVEDKVSISVWLADDAAESDVTALQATIGDLEGVASVGYTSKEQAREDFRNMSASNAEIVDQLGEDQNPFPASIDVELADPQLVDQIVGQILGNDVFQRVCDSPEDPSDSLKYGEETVDRLFTLTSWIRYVGAALVILLIFIALVFINNTIRLAILARRKEIAIMRLVGASNGFIRGPFLMEGALHAIIGSLLAVGCIELIRRFVLPQVASAITWFQIDIAPTTVFAIYGILVLAGLVIGLIGSAFAMRRYLKV